MTRGPHQPGGTVARDPVVIFEVLSDATARTDLGPRNREYEATPSVRRYVGLEQDAAGMMFERVGGDWIGRILRPDAVLRMPVIGVELPLAELYEGIDLTAAGAAEAAAGETPER